jgi:hypothetical protein
MPAGKSVVCKLQTANGGRPKCNLHFKTSILHANPPGIFRSLRKIQIMQRLTVGKVLAGRSIGGRTGGNEKAWETKEQSGNKQAGQISRMRLPFYFLELTKSYDTKTQNRRISSLLAQARSGNRRAPPSRNFHHLGGSRQASRTPGPVALLQTELKR